MELSFDGLGALTPFVTHLAETKAFYRDVLGLTPLFEDEQSAAFVLGSTVINLLNAGSAPELVEPAPVAAVGSAAQMLLSLWVEDVDAVCQELAKRGVTLLNGPVDRSWHKRTAAFTDPAGIVWEVAQDI